MGKSSAIEKPIDPELARRILAALDHACLRAAREVGDQMGFTVDQNVFKTGLLPKVITSVDYEFSITITKE